MCLLSARQTSRAECIAEEDIQTVKLVNQDTGLAKLEEAVVEDMDAERRMQGLRSSHSRGESGCSATTGLGFGAFDWMTMSTHSGTA